MAFSEKISQFNHCKQLNFLDAKQTQISSFSNTSFDIRLEGFRLVWCVFVKAIFDAKHVVALVLKCLSFVRHNTENISRAAMLSSDGRGFLSSHTFKSLIYNP